MKQSIYNRTFTVVNKGTKQAFYLDRDYTYCKSWDDTYAKPSAEKVRIKNEWEKWFTENGGHVEGYFGNTFNFSIMGEIDGQIVKICPCNNYILRG